MTKKVVISACLLGTLCLAVIGFGTYELINVQNNDNEIVKKLYTVNLVFNDEGSQKVKTMRNLEVDTYFNLPGSQNIDKEYIGWQLQGYETSKLFTEEISVKDLITIVKNDSITNFTLMQCYDETNDGYVLFDVLDRTINRNNNMPYYVKAASKDKMLLGLFDYEAVSTNATIIFTGDGIITETYTDINTTIDISKWNAMKIHVAIYLPDR